ncbi:MAG: serine/threonine protein kinase, partial [Gammaproteobacteria bacterium]|nr:serine/threonine protein kinase [Gammaproteobacteria bacterium]
MSHKQEEKKASEGKTEVFSLSYPEIPDLEVFSVLGKGGSGTVYKGQQPFLKRDVAIKVLNVTHGAINEEFVERFHREAQILADLIHPNIVSCFQAGMTTEASNYPISPYIVMEFVEGPSLQDWIKKVGVVDQITALSIIEKVASALDYAFRKSIIHRDIKAENILLKPLNTNNSLDSEFDFVPKLADLGIARSTQKDKKSNLTVVGTMIGTPSAMAPEQFNDPDNVDFKADIYGLGCVLFHMVTGTKPYEGYNLTEMVISKNSSEVLNPKEINSKLNKKIVNLILSLMAVDKNDRPSSYENLMQQCQTVRLALNKKNNIKIHSSEKKILKWGIMISVFSLLIAALVYSLGPKLTVSDSIISVPLPNTVTAPIVKEAISQ